MDRARPIAALSSRRRLLQRVGFGLLVLAIPPALSACDASRAASNRFTVQIIDSNPSGMTSGHAFSPSTIVVPQGATVFWHNLSNGVHTVTDDPAKAQNKSDAVLPKDGLAWDSGDINPGDTWSHRFDQPGTYLYFCRYDESEGMVGSVIVKSSRAATATSSGETSATNEG